MGWEEDWAPGNWKHMMVPFREPTWKIPPFLVRSIGDRKSGTTMPAGPLVDKYTVTLTMGGEATEYGHPPGMIKANIAWRPEAQEILEKRDILLGPHRQEIDEYHSQFAVCPTWTLLNQMQKKINNGQLYMEYVEDRAMRMDNRWAEGWYAMNQNALDSFSFDREFVESYVLDHKDSSVIPPTMSYGAVKWPELEVEHLKVLYESAKAYLEYKIENWDQMKGMQWKPQALGTGSRAKSPPVTGFVTEYEAEIGFARVIGYNPYLSTWYAWMGDDGPKKMYEPMISVSEEMLGVEVAFPALLGGEYWQKIAEYKEQGLKLVGGDGKTWDNWVPTYLQDYSLSAEKGVPSMVSGGATTTPANTYTNYMMSDDHIDLSWVEAIFALGDDKLIVLKEGAPDDAVKEIPGVWEFDHVATNYDIILGLVILEDRKGTFPGMYRPTIDRGSARIPLTLGKTKEDIGSKMTDENREVYYEIMGEGTLQGVPFIDRIATIQAEEFWEGWRRERYEYLGGLEKHFSVLIEDDFFEL